MMMMVMIIMIIFRRKFVVVYPSRVDISRRGLIKINPSRRKSTRVNTYIYHPYLRYHPSRRKSTRVDKVYPHRLDHY